ncbi:nuclease-related domain-containing protein [Alicyclobacillus tolerans]|uniref:Nuclease-related domain-containing protein n=1 Tax=Alicyclobacillus tolerans TaxID=90970 RepID=A0A1M6N564_9BACL|nr:nuclease-related domain-containing protein [Alicyclobacillus montanus]SHJ90766.1 Nuclease-related domain-containing protein [Alicyclobacillus montanus]
MTYGSAYTVYENFVIGRQLMMAEIVKGEQNHLESDLDDWRRRRRYAWFFIAVGALLFLIGPMATRPMYSLLGMLTIAVAAMVLKRVRTEMNVLGAGLAGEEAAILAFSELPSGYTVYSNLVVEWDGKSSQIDHVIVAPHGVFVVETKNIVGTIVGQTEESDWIQYKTTASGHTYEKRVYSPLKQVGTHVYRLAERLKEEGVRVWVQGIVYFSNPDVHLDVDGDSRMPMFLVSQGGAEKLLDYVENYEGKELSKDERRRIDRVLRESMFDPD